MQNAGSVGKRFMIWEICSSFRRIGDSRWTVFFIGEAAVNVGIGRIGPRGRALLATSRVANVPSVICNVFAGSTIGAWCLSDGRQAEDLFLWRFAVAAMAGVALYLAGNFLNDWYDRDWDRLNRPERALPRGYFKPCAYLWIAIACFSIAAGGAWVLGGVAVPVCAAIALLVAIYTVVHKRTSLGVLWIGLCRAHLVWLGASIAMCNRMECDFAAVWQMGLVGIPMLFYIMGLSLSARFESTASVPGWAAAGTIGFLALPMWLVFAIGKWIGLADPVVLVTGILPYGSWMGFCYSRRKCTSEYVAALLAGIPLVDAMWLLPLAWSGWGGWPAVALYAVPLVAFFAGWLTQKLVPAS